MNGYPVKPGAFEPWSIYEAPETLFSMIADGELTLRGALNVVRNGELLSPKEREGFSQRLKQQAPDNRIVHALIDTLTNPWVLLATATSPFAGPAIQAGTGIMGVAAKSTPFVRKWGGMLQSLGGNTIIESLRGTATNDAVQQATKRIDDLTRELGDDINAPLTKVLRSLGVKDLDYTKLSGDSAERVKRFSFALRGSLERWNRDISWQVPSATEEGLTYFTQTRKAYTTTNPDEVLRQMAGSAGIEFRDALRRGFDKRLVRLFGKDESASRLVVSNIDSNKVFNVYDGMKNNRLFRASEGDATSAILQSVAGDEVVDLLRRGKLTAEDFDNHVRSVMAPQFEGASTYFPRNVFEFVDGKTGQAMDWDAWVRQSTQQAMRPTGRAAPRSRSPDLFHPEDLRYIDEQFGGTTHTRDLTRRMDELLEDVQQKGDIQPFHRVNTAQALFRYNRETAVTSAFHASPPDEVVLDGITRANAVIGGSGREGAVLLSATNEAGGPASLAKVMADEFDNFQDPYVRKLITRFVVPTIGGVTHPQMSIAAAGVLDAKKGLGSLLGKGPLGRVLDGLGDDGKRFKRQLEEMADAEHGEEAFRRSSTAVGLTKYLYASHLGNMSSTLMNVTQPMLLGATWLGVRNVLGGYRRAIGEMLSYASERSKMGLLITPERRAGLTSKHFKYAEETGLAREETAFDLLDTAGLRAPSGKRQGVVGRRFDDFFDIAMSMFQKAEVINRSTVAHATELAYRRAGRAPSGGQFTRDMRETVLQTQFGASKLNTPVAFISGDSELSPFGRFFNNPLMRMFMSFTTRSLTGPFQVGPKLGGGERKFFGATISGRLPVTAADNLRSMGISAGVYEVTKNLLGADISRSLYFDSLSGYVGARDPMDAENPFPLPPVISIPWDFVRAVGGEDARLFGRTLSRVMPFPMFGGVQLTKVLGASPQVVLGLDPKIPFLDTVGLQTEYADWGNKSPEGKVPIFSSDGSFKRFETPLNLLLRGTGTDLGRYGSQTRLEGHALQNRREIRRIQRAAIQAIVEGNMAKYRAVRQNFSKRFGQELTISQDHIDRYMESMNQGTMQNIIEGFPKEIRDEYLRLAASEAPELFSRKITNAPEPSLDDFRAPPGGLDPQSMQRIREMYEAAQERLRPEDPNDQTSVMPPANQSPFR